MQNQIYPPQIIENSAETYIAEISTRSQIIYSSILLSILCIIVALPFITVDVSMQSPGIIRPTAEKNEVKSLLSGKVQEVFVKDNQNIAQGQPLLMVGSETLDSKLKLNGELQLEKQTYIQDLQKLVRIDTASIFQVKGISSALYRQQYNQFLYRLSESSQTKNRKAKELLIDKKLYDEKVIAQREYENKVFEYENALAYYLSAIQGQLSGWQSDLTANTRLLSELQAEEKQLLKEKELCTIKSPVAGTLQQFYGISPGSTIHSNQVLGIVSPDSDILVECYIPPKDIGFIKQDMKVYFQVDAFNYNEWGLVSGKVMQVASDIEMINDQPVFKIKCKLDKDFLQLKNGYQGKLKKGMTVRARYILTERSLYQLIFDQANDWINPLVASQS
ncbi:HlyD family efflux transporter periplasmic adaptor subunit [Rhodocytophaga rosea]|uniref:HlyD family efflux transporter periplasmic adaptor subunit n=1 Tax=Rhodocytophaga rosea TaxID=2704465 RepID=A0A6C0GBS4_9BACT|nr:HlyD family efflux transporter periplasmic adaptor subunit [Rhodocytophaga rosea]QHT65262.1 HlyD family efflux transporter periplasmic adaptor subunit [Rhodocytophaga rosea]